MIRTSAARLTGFFALTPILLTACQTTGTQELPSEPEQIATLNLMLPQRVQIQPFTKFASFDNDAVPDGILAVIRPVDQFGDPVKAAGLFYFELWTYRNAAHDRKGERIAFWDRPLDSPEQIRLYWSRAQMYEFQLAWTQGAESVLPGQKYVFTATYRTPWNETIRDEQVIEFNLSPQVFTATSPAQ